MAILAILNLKFRFLSWQVVFLNKEFVIQNIFHKVTKIGQMFLIYVTLNVYVSFAKIHITTCKEKKKGIEKKGRLKEEGCVEQFGNKDRPHEYCNTLAISA